MLIVTSGVRTFPAAVALHGDGADLHRGEFVLLDVQNLRGARAQPPHPLSALFTPVNSATNGLRASEPEPGPQPPYHGSTLLHLLLAFLRLLL